MVGPVIDQTPLGQAFHRRGDRSGADAERVGQVAGVGFALVVDRAVLALGTRVAVDRLQCLAFGFR